MEFQKLGDREYLGLHTERSGENKAFCSPLLSVFSPGLYTVYMFFISFQTSSYSANVWLFP